VSAALIVLEGIDGAGTTTQARVLAERLGAHLTCEPSTGPVGKLLRAMLGGEHAPVDATTMSLLFAADRADHLNREVEPALARGQVVVSDRWYHSSLAYQGTGEERAWIRQLNRRARTPDLTIYLEVDPEVAATRRASRDESEELFDAIETQRRVAAGYRAVVELLSPTEPIVVLDGERPMDELSDEIERLARETCEAARSRAT
jgi:dTMP kinase